MNQQVARVHQQVRYDVSLLTDHDIYLFREGSHVRLHNKLGSHLMEIEGQRGTLFSVWAPNAREVSVIGDFNDWEQGRHPLAPRHDSSGIWEGFIPGLDHGTLYKYYLLSSNNDYGAEKGDPFARYWEEPPRTASVVWDDRHEWHDRKWMAERAEKNKLDAPMSVYELHLGSWRRVPEEGNRYLTYRELAEQLVEYVVWMGYTHVEMMPVTEHPFYGSWGYQCTGYFAPTSRYGAPEDFAFLIDRLHQAGIGVILDWVPSHFPSDLHGLSYFDGTYTFEHMDPKRGYHPEWKSYIFNFGRHEVRAFLLSSALFWLEKYHVDALRVDAVASMLYLDYARNEGEWIPNPHGGHEDLDAIHFIRQLNEAVYRDHPDTQVIAEESTAWPMVSRPTYLGGLGFGMKWNMGWMHDTLDYFANDPVYRKYHHNQLTFSIWYAFNENFVLPISHDEVVYGKGSLIRKMPGDDWQKFANLRLLFGYMWAHPGKKLVFMGCEFGQWSEWDHESSLEWHSTQLTPHGGVQHWMRDLNHFYRDTPALYEKDFEQAGFEWVDFHDWEDSVISFIRKDKNGGTVLVVCNMTPVVRHNYVVGVDETGYWKEVLNSDAEVYGGSGIGNLGGAETSPVGAQGRYHSLNITLPPLGVLYFKRD
ncbi:1,4-alpha-glucan branching protein GlgB [Thiohalomonas denitrificans]|uniref:1,4-alpha-glucan branching enzyme GlgB n=1 Tax=Thiohalomonas denitrificans TaxID=415747 RepID=A0A1G5Q7I4_9GAMM|nr:1,4-alpha-glucan branching protein GlgB [Thiohalomonas denitrificans]SCZ57824.1 1,4-alpha-glucan branching enzyme [Thiohalomonas denitrificans]